MIRLAGVNGVARIASRAFNFFVFEIDLRVSADCVVTIRHRPAFKGRGIADYCGRVRSDANPNEQSRVKPAKNLVIDFLQTTKRIL